MTSPTMQKAIAKWPGLAMAIESGVEDGDGRELRLLNWIYTHPSLSSFRNTPSAILEAIDHYAGQQEFLINLGADKARIIAEIIAEEKPKVFVEIGGYVGYSAILIGNALRRVHPDDKGVVLWSLEMNPDYAAIAMSLVDLAGLKDVVKIVTGSASGSLERLKKEGLLTKIDMLMLDHVEDLYIQEFETCEKLGLLPEGSVVVADNVVRPGAPAYREMARKHPGLDSHGIKGLIMPGEFEDELEFSRVKAKAA